MLCSFFKIFVLMFLFFVGCAVKCDDSNSYYLVQMPQSPMRTRKPLKVYWNVPTRQCKSKKIPFENLYDKFGIIQNENDNFRGDKITILYDPGMFPAILSKSGNEYRFRNGGVPQNGSLEEHLNAFKDELEQFVDKDFDGVGIIDFESWRPIFRQNFGVLVPYKEVSYDLERQRHPWWFPSDVEKEAKRRFEVSGREFMEQTLSIAKEMRPKAVWGYYAYPYCFNMAKDKSENCPRQITKENDGIPWLWKQSTALYPSVYSSRELTTSQLVQLIRGRVKEAARVRSDQPILPYFWFRYRDGGLMKPVDLQAVLKAFYNSQADGFIVWGSSNDVNTEEKCIKLLNYIENTFGPTVAKYTKPSNTENDEYLSYLDDLYLSNGNVTLTTEKPVFNETNDNDHTIIDLDLELDNHAQPIIEEEHDPDVKLDEVSQEVKESVLKDLNNSVLEMLLKAWLNGLKENNKDTKTVDIEHKTSTTKNTLNVLKNNISATTEASIISSNYTTENSVLKLEDTPDSPVILSKDGKKSKAKVKFITESLNINKTSSQIDNEIAASEENHKDRKKGMPHLSHNWRELHNMVSATPSSEDDRRDVTYADTENIESKTNTIGLNYDYTSTSKEPSTDDYNIMSTINPVITVNDPENYLSSTAEPSIEPTSYYYKDDEFVTETSITTKRVYEEIAHEHLPPTSTIDSVVTDQITNSLMHQIVQKLIKSEHDHSTTQESVKPTEAYFSTYIPYSYVLEETSTNITDDININITAKSNNNNDMSNNGENASDKESLKRTNEKSKEEKEVNVPNFKSIKITNDENIKLKDDDEVASQNIESITKIPEPTAQVFVTVV